MQAKKITLAVAIGLMGVMTQVNAENLIPKNGRSCPSGYTSAGGNYCRKIEPLNNADLGHVGSFPKRDKGDRCPSGYFSNVEGTHCGTQYNPAPKVRMKAKGGCKEGETEEWGLYCTSNLQVLTASKVENASNRDVDMVYMLQRKWATQGNGLPEGYKVLGGKPAVNNSTSNNGSTGTMGSGTSSTDDTAGQIGEAVGQELKNQAVKGLMRGLFN